MMLRGLTILFLTGFLMMGMNAYSQSLSSLPGSVQPSQVGKALKREAPVSESNLPSPVSTPDEPAAKQLPAEAKKSKFQLNKIILVGNHVYSQQQLQSLYQYAEDHRPSYDLMAQYANCRNVY